MHKTYGILDKFLEELKDGYTLYLDNDMCYTQHPEKEDLMSSYSWGPKELAEVFAEELGFKTVNL